MDAGCSALVGGHLEVELFAAACAMRFHGEVNEILLCILRVVDVVAQRLEEAVR